MLLAEIDTGKISDFKTAEKCAFASEFFVCIIKTCNFWYLFFLKKSAVFNYFLRFKIDTLH